MSVPDTRRPIFDPGMDVATVVFSHVQCVRTRHSLARVSKLWRDASKPAAAYPLEFEFFDAGSRIWQRGPRMWGTYRHVIRLLDNDEALSLPYERVVRLLGGVVYYVCEDAARGGSVRLLKWARENNLRWDAHVCSGAAMNGHLPALQYVHENGCPWDSGTCSYASMNVGYYKNWDCLQYAVDNKCPGWKSYAKRHAEHLRILEPHVVDPYRPTFDPSLDVATVVFSHVQCVKTRHRLALVSKLWRDASKPAAAYPLEFDFDAFPGMAARAWLPNGYMQYWTKRIDCVLKLLDNDEALSLPYERVVGLLGEATKREVCYCAAARGSVRLLKWTRVNNWDWNDYMCLYAVRFGHLPALQYLHENGVPWDCSNTCNEAGVREHWDCLQYLVDNKCSTSWMFYAKTHAKHLR
jgi:hypothetical protein